MPPNLMCKIGRDKRLLHLVLELDLLFGSRRQLAEQAGKFEELCNRKVCQNDGLTSSITLCIML